MSYDDSGWCVTPPVAAAVGDAHSLFSPEPSSAMPIAAWDARARRFFSASLSLAPDKLYPGGSQPVADAVTVTATKGSVTAAVQLTTLPVDRCPELLRAAESEAAAIGGAGFDVLLRRTKRIWQVVGDDPPALLVAAVLASALLAPLVPRGSGICGVKGARERLAAMGW